MGRANSHRIMNATTRKIFAVVVIFVAVGLIYYKVYPQFIKLDNIPQPTCTEFAEYRSLARSHAMTQGDILIGIRLSERTGYSNFTASVIRKYQDIFDGDITLLKTGGLNYNEDMLHNWYGQNTKIYELESEETAVTKMFEVFLQTDYKVLFLLDSEMVFLPAWRDFIKTHMIRHQAIPFLSLYHSATMHNFMTDCEEIDGELCKGKIVGKHGIAITKEFAKLALAKHRQVINKYDWNQLLIKENQNGLYPPKSLIMQIGQTVQDEDFCGNNDVPYGFQLCELPCWIRTGIEFYFDLCTNPQEIYTKESAMKANLEKRLWTRPAVIFSFYGNNPRYVKGAFANAKRIYTIYPGYKIWAYVDNSVTREVLQSLCSDNWRLINMSGTQIKNQMSWRFLVAAEPVRWFTILDIDYRMLKRGKEATDDWLRSGRKFHVMRDHPNHSKYPMNGQMWGGYGNSIPNVKELIVRYNAGNTYMYDMYFLADVIWPIIKRSVWVHDAYSIHKFGEDHPFPTERRRGEFVGNVDFSAD